LQLNIDPSYLNAYTSPCDSPLFCVIRRSQDNEYTALWKTVALLIKIRLSLFLPHKTVEEPTIFAHLEHIESVVSIYRENNEEKTGKYKMVSKLLKELNQIKKELDLHIINPDNAVLQIQTKLQIAHQTKGLNKGIFNHSRIFRILENAVFQNEKLIVMFSKNKNKP